MNAKPNLSSLVTRKTLHSRNTILHGEILIRSDRTKIAFLDIIKEFNHSLKHIIGCEQQECRVDLNLCSRNVVVFSVNHKPEFALSEIRTLSWEQASPIFDLVVDTVSKIFTAVDVLKPYLVGTEKDVSLLANFRISSGVIIDGLRELFAWYCLINHAKYLTRVLVLIELEKFDYIGLFLSSKYSGPKSVQFLANNRNGKLRMGEKFSYPFSIDTFEFDMTTYISMRPNKAVKPAERVLVSAPSYSRSVDSPHGINSPLVQSPQVENHITNGLASLSISSQSTPVHSKRRVLNKSENCSSSSSVVGVDVLFSHDSMSSEYFDDEWIDEVCNYLEPVILDDFVDVSHLTRWIASDMSECRSVVPGLIANDVDIKLKTLCHFAGVVYPLTDIGLFSVKQFLALRHKRITNSNQS